VGGWLSISLKKRGYFPKRLNLNLLFAAAVFFDKDDIIDFLLILHKADSIL